MGGESLALPRASWRALALLLTSGCAPNFHGSCFIRVYGPLTGLPHLPPCQSSFLIDKKKLATHQDQHPCLLLYYWSVATAMSKSSNVSVLQQDRKSNINNKCCGSHNSLPLTDSMNSSFKMESLVIALWARSLRCHVFGTTLGYFTSSLKH